MGEPEASQLPVTYGIIAIYYFLAWHTFCCLIGEWAGPSARQDESNDITSTEGGWI